MIMKTVHWKSRENQEYINVHGERRRNTAYTGRTTPRGKQQGTPLGNAMGDFTGEVKKHDRKNVDVSKVTKICEDAMCDGADIDAIAEHISTIDDSNRVLALRGLGAEDIRETLVSWREDMIDIVSEKYGLSPDDIMVSPGNSMGNSGSSDLVLTIKDTGRDIAVETKFGSATNSAIGLQRMSEVLSGKKCFEVSPENKKLLVDTYIQGSPQEATGVLRGIMENYADDFNNSETVVDSRSLMDIIKSSGAKGNLETVGDYHVINFKADEAGAYATETPLSISEDDKWFVTVEIGEKGNNPRVNYIFTSEDGQKRIKMTYNNKNSAYVDKNGQNIVTKSRMNNQIKSGEKDKSDFLRIESNYQLSTGSYNVWYQEGIAE